MKMNLPNKLTTLRVILIPFFVAAILASKSIEWLRYAALVIFLAASFTDYLDGHLARKYNLITNFGKFMDPLADKLLVCSALICLQDLGLLPAVVVIIIVAREFAISAFRLIASDNGIVIAASYWGKFKTVSQMIMIVLVMLQIEQLSILTTAFIWIATILTIVSLVDYIWKNRQVLLQGGM